MAVIKEISKEAIKQLGKTVIFSSWKGILYVKTRTTKKPPPPTALQLVMRRRFRIAWGLINLMDDTVRDLYKYWAQGTSYTWKDLAIREIMSIWHTTGQTPITLRHFSWTLAEGVLTIQVAFNKIFTDPGAGYGLTGWGNSPWGSPPAFLSDDGYAAFVHWHLAYGDPIPWPQTGFTY